MNLDDLFELAKEHYCRHFGLSYEEFLKQWGLKSDFKFGVLKYMDFLLRLREADGWARKLEVDKKNVDLQERRLRLQELNP